MHKVLIGVLLGIVLGALDGATAWFTPAVRDQLPFIMMASSLKGLMAGLVIGIFAWRVRSLAGGLIVGGLVGLLLAFLVAMQPNPDGTHYWLEIMIPGTIVGFIIGWATQHYGKVRQPATA